MTQFTPPLVNLQDAGHQCAAPVLALNASGLSTIREALDRAERTGDEVVVMVVSPAGRRSPLTIKRLPELSAESAAEAEALELFAMS